jgi:hypothetical protein
LSAEGTLPRHFQADENCVPLTGESRVRLYLAQLRRALDRLGGAVAADAPVTNAERQAIDGFLARLRHTLDALALRHFFAAPDAALRIDASDSGFPHLAALLELAADAATREARLAALPPRPVLLQRMLDEIVEHSLHPRELQAALMERLHLEHLDPARLLRAFLPGELVKVGGPEDTESHLWSFTTWDGSLNRPYLHLLYFAYAGRPEALAAGGAGRAALEDAAERAASGRLGLLAVARRIDEILPEVRPRIVKRLCLGPFLAPGFTRLAGELGALLERHAERLPFLLQVETEILLSEREERVGAGWLSRGELRQIFWVPRSLELAARGASQVLRLAVLPHWLAAHVESAGLLPDHRILWTEEDDDGGD